MQFPFLAALAATALLTQDLDAQRRGRFTRGGQGGEQAPPSAETKTEETKSDKPKAHLAIVGGDVYLGTGQRITGATVLVGDDKILAVGHNLELPEGTTVIEDGDEVATRNKTALELGNAAHRLDRVALLDEKLCQVFAQEALVFEQDYVCHGGESTPCGTGESKQI